jgi:hypothetical protein
MGDGRATVRSEEALFKKGPWCARAITAIAHTLLKIAYSVLKTGRPYADLGADFCTRRESPDARQDYLTAGPRPQEPPSLSPARRPPGSS